MDGDDRHDRLLGAFLAADLDPAVARWWDEHLHHQVAALLGVAAVTVSTRMRDGPIRLRDCLGWIMRSNRPEVHTLAAAYALDALTRADRARFERHLARCEQCAREVSVFAEATAVAAEPPAAGGAKPAAMLPDPNAA